MKKLKLGIVDSSALLHRAKFASLKDNSDQFVLFLSYIQDFQRKLNCDRIILCNDLTTSRYRQELDKEYKSHRGKYDKEPTVKELEAKKTMSKLRKNLYLLEPYFINGNIYGVEADDVMGMLANDEDLKDRFDIYVISTDKDLLSAVHYSKIFNPMKNELRGFKDLKGLQNRNEFLMYQSFMSDSQDTLITLKGIGEKTAIKLAQRFKNFKELKEFLSDKSNIENETDRYVKKAFELLKNKTEWEKLGTIFKIVSIFRDISKLSDDEVSQYNKIKDNILSYNKTDFEVSNFLDEFVLENNFDMDCYDLLEELVSDFK